MKERLLKVKKMLERKCFSLDNSVESDLEYYLDVIKKIDNEGAVSFLNGSFEQFRNYCELNNIEFNNLNLFVRMMLFYDERYQDRYEYIKAKKINPLDEIILINISGVSHSNDEKEQSEDPDSIVENKYFCVTFEDFKSLLEENGMNIGLNSFDELKRMFFCNKTLCSRVNQSKIKKKIKNR